LVRRPTTENHSPPPVGGILIDHCAREIVHGCWSGDAPKAHKLRQRRTSYAPTQSTRTSSNNGRRRDGADTLPLTLTLFPAANNGRRRDGADTLPLTLTLIPEANNGMRRDGSDTLPLTLTLIPEANNGRDLISCWSGVAPEAHRSYPSGKLHLS
jgi:hypothetical protein